MKFIRCLNCDDIVALRRWIKCCKCGESYGLFLSDNRTALVNTSRFVHVFSVDNNCFSPAPYFVIYRNFDKDAPIENEVALYEEAWKAADVTGCGGLNLMRLFMDLREAGKVLEAEQLLDRQYAANPQKED